MANTYRPNKGVSIRDVPADATDRKNTKDSFKERKANQDKIKDERFAKIEKRRKAARDGKGKGINVEVTGDN